jgi:hypothetical protein
MDKKLLNKTIKKGKNVNDIRIINYKEKMKFSDELLAIAEKIVKENKCKARTDSIVLVKQRCHPRHGFEKKN